MQPQSAHHWIIKLNLQPHPEGGYYREVFRSQMEVSRANESNIKPACTSIYYLLEGTDYSGFHRLASDELWYFHAGVPLAIHEIDKTGALTTHQLSNLETGNLSVAITAGSWFAAEVPSANGFALVSCAVAPGFDFNEFEMAKKEELIGQFPQHGLLLERLCRE